MNKVVICGVNTQNLPNLNQDKKLELFQKIKGKQFLHRFVCAHGAAPRKIAVACNSHHRQGVSLPSRKKSRTVFVR